MFDLAGQITDLIGSLFKHIVALLKVSALWFVLMLVCFVQSGVYGAGGAGTINGMIWQFGGLIALLAGWYSAHRFAMNTDVPARLLPPFRSLGGFMGAELKLMMGLSIVASIAIMPLMGALMADQYTHLDLRQDIPVPGQLAPSGPPTGGLNEQDLRGFIMALGVNPDNINGIMDGSAMPETPWYVNVPVYVVTFVLFVRFLLVAPLAARGIRRPIAVSWRSTRGHWGRLSVLQAVALLPAIAGIALASWLDSEKLPYALHVWITGLNVAGEFMSVWLFVLLAEDEFAQLYDPAAYKTAKAEE